MTLSSAALFGAILGLDRTAEMEGTDPFRTRGREGWRQPTLPACYDVLAAIRQQEDA